MRTNIDIDDKLMKQAMKATGASLRKLLEVHANEQAMDRAMRRQERERQAAMRAGRLEEWYAELVKNGTKLEEPLHANQH
jgi:Arc/MetJ family transcription regulator